MADITYDDIFEEEQEAEMFDPEATPRNCAECKEEFTPSWEHNFDTVCDECHSEKGKKQVVVAPPNSLEVNIAAYIYKTEGCCATAREMAKAFNITKTEVNKVLYKNPKFTLCGERGKTPLWTC